MKSKNGAGSSGKGGCASSDFSPPVFRRGAAAGGGVVQVYPCREHKRRMAAGQMRGPQRPRVTSPYRGSPYAVLQRAVRAPPPSSPMVVREPAARIVRVFAGRRRPPLEAPRARGERAAHRQARRGDQRVRLRAGLLKEDPSAPHRYIALGIDAEATLKANREAFSKYYLRPRRLNDVSKVDMSVDILGAKYPNPIFICPTGGNKAYHPDGEAAVARAAKTGGHLEMLATPATTSMEDAIAA